MLYAALGQLGQDEWLKRYPEAGSSWLSWLKASYAPRPAQADQEYDGGVRQGGKRRLFSPTPWSFALHQILCYTLLNQVHL